MLAQVMEMRTDVRRTALWQAPVQGQSYFSLATKGVVTDNGTQL
jgi:hypothetical protein